MSEDADRYRRLRTLFDAAAELSAEAQRNFVLEHCSDDTQLAEQLSELLRQERALAGSSTDAAFGSPQQAMANAMPDLVVAGSTLGGYRVVDELGVGGMGRVFRAERVEGGVKLSVAIKLLRQELVNPELVKRFATERKLLAGLNHPGICRVIDVGTHVDGTPFVVMEMLDGLPLLAHCDQYHCSVSQRLQLFRQVLAAVSYAHQSLIVHRDIKSSNILVDSHGVPKLLDFGIAKALGTGPDATMTATQDRYLSLGNAAPEQLLGGHLTVACDVYALGTVLYELLCGSPPFDFSHLRAGEIEAQILKTPPASMTRWVGGEDRELAQRRALATSESLRKALSGDLERIVQKCLRKEALERYASVEQLDDDIAAYLENRPIRAASMQRWYVLRKFVSRNRLAVALSAAFAAAICVAIGAVLIGNAAAIQERDRAQQALNILRQAFLSADPASVAGADVTVREVLDTAVPTLELSFDTHPELYATLAGTIAEVQLKLGLSTPSAQLFDRAADAANRSKLSIPEHFNLLILRARALHGAGDYERAKLSLTEALALGVPANAEWKVVKAATLHHDGDFKGAVELLREAILMFAGRPADDEWSYTARIRLAQALQNLGANDEALAVLRETIDWQRLELGDRHPRVALTELQLVMREEQMGLGEEVLQDTIAVHARVSAVFGEDSIMTAKASMVLANALSSQGQYAEATTINRRVLAIFTNSLGGNHPNSLKAAYNLAASLGTEPEDLPEALDILRKTVATAELKLGSDSSLATFFRDEYVWTLLEGGDAELALVTITSPESIAGMPGRSRKSADKAFALLQQAHQSVCEDGIAQGPVGLCTEAARQISTLSNLQIDP